MTVASKIELMSRLGTFRPSDRKFIEDALTSTHSKNTALDAIKEFVRRWEEASWLEAYSIERIGKWLAKYQADDISHSLREWCAEKPANAKQEARQALALGIGKGLEERTKEYA